MNLNQETKAIVASNLTVAEFSRRPRLPIKTGKPEDISKEILDTFTKYLRHLHKLDLPE